MKPRQRAAVACARRGSVWVPLASARQPGGQDGAARRTATLAGARTTEQFTEALSVETLSLPDEIIRTLEDGSAPVHRQPDHDWSTL